MEIGMGPTVNLHPLYGLEDDEDRDEDQKAAYEAIRKL
jgi:hypothetical protein